MRVAEAFDELAGRKNYQSERVIGPLGESLTLENLPATNTSRWTPLRKAEVVAAVEGGLLSVEEACRRYSLSIEEFTRWQSAINSRGVRGLRVTRIQEYRGFHKEHPAQSR
ncbi:DUF1153 domain-containing protein [Sphingomonas sp.]|uniref:CtrA inhibitor SciP n=1 Tax=Sphingomonas sp. TaxID=28214 RepID=UPI0025F7F1CD|nr:DUF1153 domain-containing protein [Sphingomonas sp.]